MRHAPETGGVPRGGRRANRGFAGHGRVVMSVPQELQEVAAGHEVHERFMRLALEEARTARRAGEVPVGAVVVVDGEVVGIGHNSTQALIDPSAHAEVLALRMAAARIGNHRLTGSTLYCTVEPCLMCLGTAMHARISRLVFGASDLKIGAVGRLEALRSAGADFNHRFEVRGGVLAEEAAALLVEFFRERRTASRAEAPCWRSRVHGEVPKWS